MTNLPSVDRLRAALRYDSETGELLWKPRGREEFKTDRAYSWWNARYACNPAGSSRNGYIALSLDGSTPLAHRVIWAMVHGAWPERDIDHINHDRSDNRLANLRQVDRGENNRNHSLSRRNTSGVVGVRKTRGRWKVEIGEVARHVGHFDTFAEAVIARQEAEKARGFHENHGAALRSARWLALIIAPELRDDEQ